MWIWEKPWHEVLRLSCNWFIYQLILIQRMMTMMICICILFDRFLCTFKFTVFFEPCDNPLIKLKQYYSNIWKVKLNSKSLNKLYVTQLANDRTQTMTKVFYLIWLTPSTFSYFRLVIWISQLSMLRNWLLVYILRSTFGFKEAT